MAAEVYRFILVMMKVFLKFGNCGHTNTSNLYDRYG